MEFGANAAPGALNPKLTLERQGKAHYNLSLRFSAVNILSALKSPNAYQPMVSGNRRGRRVFNYSLSSASPASPSSSLFCPARGVLTTSSNWLRRSMSVK